MAKIDVPRLVFKVRRGRQLCYWNPSATLVKAGWKMAALGTDIEAAIVKAKKLNLQVDEWRDGGAKPRAVKAFLKRGTMSQLIARYKEMKFIDPANGGHELSTQRTYGSSLKVIEKWAGPELVEHISRARIRKLLAALLKPDSDGKVHLYRAGGIMRVLHTLMAFAIEEGFLPESTPNPAARHDIPGAPPRDHVWSQPAIDLFCQAALEAQQPSMALAIHLGREVTQREADIIGLTRSKWVIIPRHKLNTDDWERMAEPEPDGTRSVRGIRLRQGKTKRWVEVPVVGELRAMMEAAAAQAEAEGEMMMLRELAIPTNFRDVLQFERSIADELRAQTGRDPSPALVTKLRMERRVPRNWTETRFQRAIADLRDRAAEIAREQDDEDLAEEIAALQYRDLRRTGVVWLGELGIEDHLIAAITGHSLDETKQILETYMPRSTKMAGRAIVLRLERDPAKEPTAKKA